MIENYTFPDSIYSIIGYRVGVDLANEPKPKWLSDLEAGVSPGSGPTTNESTTQRPYSYWANGPSDMTSGYYERGPADRPKERDGRGSSSSASGIPLSTPGDSPYYPYQSGGGRQSFSSHGPPPHTLPPIEGSGDATSRFNFTSGQPGAGSTTTVPHNRSNPPWGVWDEQNRSPNSTSSSYDAQRSQSSAATVSPRQPAWPDSKPDLTLPPLQEAPSSPYNDWKDRSLYVSSSSSQSSAIRGGALPSMSAMPSFGSVASQASGYAAVQSGAAAGWVNSAGAAVYGTAATWDSNNSSSRPRTGSAPRYGSFIPTSLEVKAHTADSIVPLTTMDPTKDHLVTQPPIPWYSIYMWQTRYPFLEQVAQAPGVPVYHIDVPITLPVDYNMREALSDGVNQLGLRISLRPIVSETTTWGMTSDSGFFHPATGTMRYPRTYTVLQAQRNNDLAGTVKLPELARLYEQFVRDDSDSLASVAIPMSALIHRVVRDDSPDARTPPHHTMLPQLGSDWSSAAAIFIYSFWVAESWTNPAPPVSCRPVDFDGSPGSEVAAAEDLAARLLAGEEAQPSKFAWL